MIYSLLCEGGSLVYSGGSARLLKNPLVSSDFIWDEDNSPTLWVESDEKETHWDNGVHMRLEPPTFKLWVTGPTVTFRIGRKEEHKEYWLEAGGACGMWLEEDNRTYTEWWDEIESFTPWDQGITPWDTTNTIDTAWDRQGTGEYEKTYWYDFVAIGYFVSKGQTAGWGRTLHAGTGEFNVEPVEILYDNIGKRTKTGVFTVTGIRASLRLTAFSSLEAGSFKFKGRPSEVYWYQRGPIDHILDATPEDTPTFNLNGGESKGKYVQGGCVRNPTEWDTHKPKNTEWDTHNVRETWWDTHKLRCLHPEPATFILTGMDAESDDYTHFSLGTGNFFVDEEVEVEWDDNTTIWQEDDGLDTEWWDSNNIYTSFNLAKYSGSNKFRLTGNKAGKHRGYALKAGAGAFVLTGNDVEFINTIPYRLTPETGIFTLTGNNASGSVGGHTSAGLFTLSGQDINIQRDRLLKAQPRHFKLSGQPSETTLHKIYYVDGTSYTLTGMDVKAKIGGGIEVGSFILTGQDALREDHRGLTANTGVFTLDGVSSGIHYFKDLSGTSFTLTGYDTNRQQRHISRVGEFNLEGQDASRDRHPTLKVTEAGEFTLTGYNSSVGLLKPSLEAATFVVDGVDAGTNVNITRTVKPTHYVLTGENSYGKAEAKKYFESGIFEVRGKAAGLRVNRGINWSVSAATVFVVNGLPTEQDRNQTLSAEAGEFIVKYDCNAKSFKAATGEFILSGQRAVFNSKHYTFNAGPNAHFRVELQAIHRYGDHDYGKTLEYTLTGSDVFFRCGEFDYTKWDSASTNWDTFRSLWDKRYLGDKPCAIRPDTVQPATFILTGKDVDGYTNNSDYPDAIAFDAGELRVSGAGSNQNWIAETGHFRVEMTSVSYYDYSIDNAGRFEVGSGGEIGGVVYRDSDQEVVWDDDNTIWKEFDMNQIIDTRWYSGDNYYENLVPCISYTNWDDGETVWKRGYTEWDREVNSGCQVTPSGSSGTGVFLLNGMDVGGYTDRKPNNVILLANHRGDFHVLNCDKDKETFWDERMGTDWFDNFYGTALWDSETAESAVKWDPDDATRTQWDKDKSRWDKNKCTELNLDYRLVANCK